MDTLWITFLFLDALARSSLVKSKARYQNDKTILIDLISKSNNNLAYFAHKNDVRNKARLLGNQTLKSKTLYEQQVAII